MATLNPMILAALLAAKIKAPPHTRSLKDAITAKPESARKKRRKAQRKARRNNRNKKS